MDNEAEHERTKVKRRRVQRRRFLRHGSALAGAALMTLVPDPVRQAAWAAGSDAPEKKEVKVGFIPLADCASVVMASVLGFDRKHGIRITPSREASWASVRDKLVSGALDASHVLYGLVYAVQLGIAGPKKDMAILMTLNHNGQAITLSRKLADAGAVDGASFAVLLRRDRREYTFAQTFPTGTHAMWLYYWLAAHGIDPFREVKTITIPPPQMAANMRAGNMDGYCVGEPWGHQAIADGTGICGMTTQAIWQDHPEKVLGTTAQFVRDHPNTCRAMTAAIIEAGRWIDTSRANRLKMAETVAAPAWVNSPVDVISPRILGRYEDGLGRTWDDPNHMRFYNDGLVPFPFLSDGMWFLTQQRRWGLLKTDPDYLAVAQEVNQIDLYKQAAAAVGASVPAEPLRSSKLMDGATWDGTEPARYAGSFAVHA